MLNLLIGAVVGYTVAVMLPGLRAKVGEWVAKIRG